MAPRAGGKKPRKDPFYRVLRGSVHVFRPDELARLLPLIDRRRVDGLATALSTYISVNLPSAIERRDGLADYRTNPYVLMTSAWVMKLEDPKRFADFLFNNKLYMGLETSFGKSIEAAFVGPYPLARGTLTKWVDPPEKVAEAGALTGLSREEKAKKRTGSVWREIDKSCVIGRRRYLTSIKSGPNCINDTQVQGMTSAIIDHHQAWMQQTRATYTGVTELDVMIGITYGTDCTTNNKENQILVKLLNKGFKEEDRRNKPGVLIDSRTRSTRVYRRVGSDFWNFIGNPAAPETCGFVFLEVLLALAKALSRVMETADLETKINDRIRALVQGLQGLMFPRESLPEWMREQFSAQELLWFATAMSAFFDEGV